jgi:hypothetical protein
MTARNSRVILRIMYLLGFFIAAPLLLLSNNLQFDPYYHRIDKTNVQDLTQYPIAFKATNTTGQDIQLLKFHSACQCLTAPQLPIILSSKEPTPIEVTIDTTKLKKTAYITIETDYNILPFYVLSIDATPPQPIGLTKNPSADAGNQKLSLTRTDFDLSRSKATDRIKIVNPTEQKLEIKNVQIFIDDKKVPNDIVQIQINEGSIGIQVKDPNAITGILHGDIEIGPSQQEKTPTRFSIGVLGLFFDEPKSKE